MHKISKEIIDINNLSEYLYKHYSSVSFEIIFQNFQNRCLLKLQNKYKAFPVYYRAVAFTLNDKNLNCKILAESFILIQSLEDIDFIEIFKQSNKPVGLVLKDNWNKNEVEYKILNIKKIQRLKIPQIFKIGVDTHFIIRKRLISVLGIHNIIVNEYFPMVML